ncbi:GTP-binding protein [Porifericola rhodea]|uniref:Rab family GTPase n=1 Tax=Porifericola rhodea TaxID=930972 RepID=UPI002664EDC0|nr:Rab family GTPase [Porifericola rhodea]WKN33697.1 GTP-binding protein [Porifericola rhodea]
MRVSKKVILLGRYGVGKSSLVRQFVYHKFSEQYMTTIGVSIEKKVVQLGENELSMIIWDIAGESSHAKVPDAYKLGAEGVIYVFDMSRPATYQHLQEELDSLQKLLVNVPILLVGNKKDLLSEKEQNEILKSLPLSPYALSSAKTGENVEDIFLALAQKLL